MSERAREGPVAAPGPRGAEAPAAFPPERAAFLLVRTGGALAALPLGDVALVTRPLPVEPIAGAPPYVAGLSVIRGRPVPVVSLAALIASDDAAAPRRFVAVRAGERWVALAVDDVLAVRALDPRAFEALPALLRDARKDTLAAVGALDERLLLVLRAGRIVPDELWPALGGGAAP